MCIDNTYYTLSKNICYAGIEFHHWDNYIR